MLANVSNFQNSIASPLVENVQNGFAPEKIEKTDKIYIFR